MQAIYEPFTLTILTKMFLSYVEWKGKDTFVLKSGKTSNVWKHIEIVFITRFILIHLWKIKVFFLQRAFKICTNVFLAFLLDFKCWIVQKVTHSPFFFFLFICK